MLWPNVIFDKGGCRVNRDVRWRTAVLVGLHTNLLERKKAWISFIHSPKFKSAGCLAAGFKMIILEWRIISIHHTVQSMSLIVQSWRVGSTGQITAGPKPSLVGNLMWVAATWTRQQLIYSTELNLTSETKSHYSRATVALHSIIHLPKRGI